MMSIGFYSERFAQHKNSYAELFPYSIYPSGRASLDTRGIPVKLGDGPNDLLCGACGQKAIVGLGNVDMVSDVERMIPVVVRCGGCGAHTMKLRCLEGSLKSHTSARKQYHGLKGIFHLMNLLPPCLSLNSIIICATPRLSSPG